MKVVATGRYSDPYSHFAIDVLNDRWSPSLRLLFRSPEVFKVPQRFREILVHPFTVGHRGLSDVVDNGSLPAAAAAFG